MDQSNVREDIIELLRLTNTGLAQINRDAISESLKPKPINPGVVLRDTSAFADRPYDVGLDHTTINAPSINLIGSQNTQHQPIHHQPNIVSAPIPQTFTGQNPQLQQPEVNYDNDQLVLPLFEKISGEMIFDKIVDCFDRLITKLDKIEKKIDLLCDGNKN